MYAKYVGLLKKIFKIANSYSFMKSLIKKADYQNICIRKKIKGPKGFSFLL